jgi:hypothetical protein
MSYTDFKEVPNVDTGDSTHYGSDQLKEIVQIFNGKIVANRRPNIKNPWRYSDRIEMMAAPSIPIAPTSTNYINFFLDPSDFHLKVQDSTGTLTDIQQFSLDTNTLAYTSPSNNVVGDILKNSGVKYIRFPRGNQDEVLTATATDLQYQKIVNANISATAAIGWTKVDKTGSKLRDIADASTLSGVTNGQVPTWNNAAQRWDPQTPPGSSTGEANTASNQGVGGVGLFNSKVGVDLQFKNINAGSNKVTITNDAGNKEVDIDVAQANLSLSAIGGSITDAQYPNIPSGKTYNIDTNTLKHSSTNAQGDILAYDTTASKYIRIPRGTANQALRVNSGGTDITWTTITVPNVLGGIATFSGNAVTKIFNIAHGAGTTPTKYSVTPASQTANFANYQPAYPAEHNGAQYWITADATNLIINYGYAPVSGTNNLTFSWQVFV